MFPRRLLTLVAAVALALLGSLASPLTARACACGAAPGAEVDGEQSLITFDGTTEQVDLLLRLARPTDRAAWIMPTPPSTTLALGSVDVDKLSAAIRPVTRTRLDWTPRLPWDDGDRAAAGAPPSGSKVQVTTTEVGHFRVSTLSGTDASSVTQWLQEHDFPTADEQLPTFQRYLDQGWTIQAVELLPEASGAFSGSLPPLRMSFPTQQIVYPMALSQHASRWQPVRLFVAAPFQVKVATEASSANPLRTVFAGEVDPAVVGRTSGLGDSTAKGSPRVYLTAFEATLDPDRITGDYLFEQTPDAPHQEVIWQRDTTPGRVLGGVLVLGVPVLAAGGLFWWLLARGRRRAA
ncbi:DUF2330 domain-containing protein [Aestuariimicrobium soli]|uniref:DUF2330 domain-containing protein n=1 Tax=Aestuariimicrobium soli TaxID=2035834 RepID=UPI003EBF2FE7